VVSLLYKGLGVGIVIKKIFLVLLIVLIISGCANTSGESEQNQQAQDRSNDTQYEEVAPKKPLIEDFPVVEEAKLVEYFDFYGTYQYTFYTEKEEKEIRDYLIAGLKEIGIVATGYNTSQFTSYPSKDISMVDGSNQGALGYIIVHPKGSADYGDVKGYTVLASEILFDYEPIYMEPIEVSNQDLLPLYNDAILIEYEDNSEDFIPTKKYTYFVKIDYFSGLDETELMFPEVKEVYEFYINYFEQNNYRYDIYPNEIDATKGSDHVIVNVSSYDISGVLVGAKIEMEIEQ